MIDINSLTNIANQFRKKFESTDLSQAPGFLSGFPEGCCSWATWMIGHYLKFELMENVLEIQGERFSDDGTDNHAWLDVGGIIVGITSDEFNDSEERIIVSNNSDWHTGWTIINTAEIERIETYNQINYGTKLKPSDVYELLVEDV